MATRCLLDGLGLFVAGSEEHSVRLLIEDAEQIGGRPDALLLGRGNKKVPAPMAARVLGTAGHAHDWDDSQVSLRSGPYLRAFDSSNDSAVNQRAGHEPKTRRRGRQNVYARLSYGL